MFIVEAGRDLVDCLVTAAGSRERNLLEILSYEFSILPFSLAHHDGSVRKISKGILLTVLRKMIEVHPSLSRAISENGLAHFFDAITVIQMTKYGGSATFDEKDLTSCSTMYCTTCRLRPMS